MSNQLAVTRVPGVPVSEVNDKAKAVLPVPDCPHAECHGGFAQFVAFLQELDANYEIEQVPYDYAESPPPHSEQWNAEQRGSILRILLPALVSMKRQGEDLAKLEAMASMTLTSERERRGKAEPFSDGTAILFSPFSLN